MILAKCIDKHRDDRGNITQYVLEDICTNKLYYPTKEALYNILAGKNTQIKVINLKLTSNGRIVNDLWQRDWHNPKEVDLDYEIDSVKKLLAKASLFNLPVQEFKGAGKSFYIISKQPWNHIMYIPKGVEYLRMQDYTYRRDARDDYDLAMNRLKGYLKVVGGLDLVNATSMFESTNLELLDLSAFKTNNCLIMRSMFAYSVIPALDLTSFDVSKVNNMRDMFRFCQIIKLDLSSFRLNKQADVLVTDMFKYSDINNIKFGDKNLQKFYNTAVS